MTAISASATGTEQGCLNAKTQRCKGAKNAPKRKHSRSTRGQSPRFGSGVREQPSSRISTGDPLRFRRVFFATLRPCVFAFDS